MKNFLLAGVVLVAVASGPALSADLPPRQAPPPIAPVVVAPVFSWTGCYIGGHVGYHRSSYDQHLSFDDNPPDTPTEFHFTDSLLAKGFDGGGQILGDVLGDVAR